MTSKLQNYTFKSLMDYFSVKYEKRPALSTIDGNTVTYGQLKQQSLYISKLLRFQGLNTGDKVAIYSVGRPEWGISYFGIVNTGMIAVPLLTDFSASEVENFTQHCNCKAIIVDAKLFEKIRCLGEKLPQVVINISDFNILKGEVCSQKEVSSFELPQVEINEEDTASIIYTSGTTGRSKGVELTHKNLVWGACSGRSVFKITKHDRCLSFLPLSHVYEFTVGFTFQLLHGSHVYYLGKMPTVSTLLPAFRKVRPTNVESVPMIIEKIYKHKILPTLNQPKIAKLYKNYFGKKLVNLVIHNQLKQSFGGKLRFFGIGGAKLDSNIEGFLKEIRFPYAVGYGLTETSPLLAAANPKLTRKGTVGPVIKGVTLKTINVNKETGIGEVVAKGPNVMKGYYNAPELTAQAFTTKEDECGEGWFKTGDLGILEGQTLSLKGRCKNMILTSSGENVYPEDIEFVLNSHPLVSESLVMEDEGNLIAVIALNDQKLITGDITRDVLEFVNKRMRVTSRIARVKIVTAFEKSATQKIKRYLYKKAALIPNLVL